MNSILTVYPAIFHEESGNFWVEFPDLPGCQSEGDSLEEIMQNASEVLGLYLNSQRERNITTSKASDIRSIEKPEDGFVSLVTVDTKAYERRTKAVKKTLTIPEWLNIEAEKRHINFSSVLQQALIEKIETEK